MIVCIAEKPSVAKDIARIIGANASRDGYMEGNGYQVTWTFGHLCELKEPDDYTPMWKRWSLSALPMIPQRFGIKLINDEGIKKQFATIERLMQAADSIINCGDAGQEGELIQRWVMQKAQAKCPVKRLWISSMTDEAIRQGFQELKDQSEYQSLYLAGLSRAIGDWILGMNATRLYTLKYGQNRQVLSIGRVQTPTLALIVNRQKEIDNFEPEPYWVLATIYRDTQFTATSGKFTSKEEGEKAFSTIAGKPFTVTGVTKKKGTEAPPHLYDLTSLQVDCNKKFSYSADMTLKLIQSLYEKKFTTYPRVDTQFLTDDIYPKCPQILNGVSQAKIASQQKYLPLIQQLAASGKPLSKSKKVFDNSKVTDHHAIIPTGVPPTGLTDMEANVYDLIAKRFICVFYPDCKFSTTTVMGEVVNEDGDKPEKIEFKVSGKEILEPGWRDVYAKDGKQSADDDDNTAEGNGAAKKENVEERTLPSFVKGESGEHIPTLTEKWTTPPKYYTEATLLRAMETAGKFVEDEELRAALKENGIGRPSSRAGIIETLFKRHYIRRQRKNLLATPTGIELIDTIHEELLKSCELTGIWEKKLRDIEHKTYNPADFIDGLKEQINQIVKDVLSDNSARRVTVMTEEDLAKKPAPKKKAAPKKKPATTQTADDIVGKPCPVCGQGTIIKGKTAYGCSNWKNGCQYRQPFTKVFLYIIIMCNLFLTGCGIDKNLKKGEKFLALGEYFDAADQFKQAYSKTPAKERDKRGQRALKMARCYAKINATSKAIAAYKNAIRYNQASLPDRLTYAQMLLKNGDYKLAATEFKALLDSLPNEEMSQKGYDVLARNGLKSAQMAPEWKAKGSRYTVKRMDVFNSRRDDFSPMIFGDDYDQLYFTSTRNEAQGDELSGITGTKNGDIFLSEKDDKGKWSKPEAISTGLNTDYDEGACCFTPDGGTMYLTQCVTDPSSPRFAQIMTSPRSDAAWGKATALEITKDTLSSYAHPAISPDGEWLYFTSDMPGGMGGLDIWRVRITAAGLGGVENLGEPINTPGDESFPTFRPNGDLYFSSNGHAGMGGLDIFIAKVDPKTKKYKVYHPGYPLNSEGDDFGMTFEGPLNKGFFSSNRKDGRGYDHIYSFENPEIVTSVKGWVYEMGGYELPAAQVTVVGNDGTYKKVPVKGDGSFSMVIKPQVDYLLMASCKGFLNHKEELRVDSAAESKEYTLQFPLASITAPVLIDNIFYDFDKATLTDNSTKALDELVKLLQENPNVTIELSAHCDYKGSADYNKRLSQRRAESVVDYLIKHGIAKDRLTPVGYGKDQPKTIRKKITETYPWLKEGDKLSEEFILKQSKEHQEICNQLNRRTEFIVLRTTYGMFDEKGNLKNPPKPKKQEEEVSEDEIFIVE